MSQVEVKAHLNNFKHPWAAKWEGLPWLEQSQT